MGDQLGEGPQEAVEAVDVGRVDGDALLEDEGAPDEDGLLAEGVDEVPDPAGIGLFDLVVLFVVLEVVLVPYLTLDEDSEVTIK